MQEWYNQIRGKTDKEIYHLVKMTQLSVERHESGRFVMKDAKYQKAKAKLEFLKNEKTRKKNERLDKERASWVDYWNSFI